MAEILPENIERKLFSPRDRSWIDDANCKGIDTDIFFPESASDIERARAICAACVVQLACREYALRNRMSDGVWGGEPNGGKAPKTRGRPKKATS